MWNPATETLTMTEMKLFSGGRQRNIGILANKDIENSETLWKMCSV